MFQFIKYFFPTFIQKEVGGIAQRPITVVQIIKMGVDPVRNEKLVGGLDEDKYPMLPSCSKC